jgi:hypothetical protein
MTIEALKFSEWPADQKKKTSELVAGWIANNLFINPESSNIEFQKNSELFFQHGADSKILITELDSPKIVAIDSIESWTGYIVNWGTSATVIQAGEGVTILPYNVCQMTNAFGVFKIEKTGVSELTVSVIENGVLMEY